MSVRWVARLSIRTVVGSLIVAAMLAPAIAAVVDRGPTGTPRASAFYLALVLSDDAAVASLAHSLLLASSTSALAGVIGVGLGRSAMGRGFPGHGALVSLARAPASFPPLISALGVLGISRLIGLDPNGAWRWLALGWVELAWGVPRVMAAAGTAFAGVSLSSIDASRMAGAGRRQAWWMSAWPPARGPVARSVAEVFALTFFEPGAPLILGLQRTLPHAVVSSALGLDGSVRAAALCVIGLVMVLAGRAAILAAGGASRAKVEGGPTGRVGLLPTVGLGLWVAIAILPVGGLAVTALGMDRSGRLHPEGFFAIARDHTTILALGRGLMLGIAATALAGLVARGLGPGARHPSWRTPTTWLRIVPPLVIGLGVMLLPGLLDMILARTTRGSGPLRGLANALDPYLHPWIALIVATAALRISELRSAFAEAADRTSSSGEDVARTLGATPIRAWLTASAPSLASVLAGAVAVSVSACALDAGPALLLSPTLAARPISPSIWRIASEPDGLRQAASLALVALVLPVFAWIVAGSRYPRRTRLSRA